MGTSPSQQRARSAAPTVGTGSSSLVHEVEEMVMAVCLWPERLNSVEEIWISADKYEVKAFAANGRGQARHLQRWQHGAKHGRCAVNAMTLVDNGSLLVTSGRHPDIHVWETKHISKGTGDGSDSPPLGMCALEGGHDLSAVALAAPSGQFGNLQDLVSGARDTVLLHWDISRNHVVSTNRRSRNVINHLCWNPADAHQFAQTAEDKVLKLWDTRSFKVTTQFPEQAHITSHCDMHSNGHSIACTLLSEPRSGLPQVLIWDSRKPDQPMFTFRSFTSARHKSIFCPGSDRTNNWVVSIGDNNISLRDYTQADSDARKMEPVTTHVSGRPYCMAWSPRTMSLMCGGCQGGLVKLAYNESEKDFKLIGNV